MENQRGSASSSRGRQPRRRISFANPAAVGAAPFGIASTPAAEIALICLATDRGPAAALFTTSVPPKLVTQMLPPSRSRQSGSYPGKEVPRSSRVPFQSNGESNRLCIGQES